MEARGDLYISPARSFGGAIGTGDSQLGILPFPWGKIKVEDARVLLSFPTTYLYHYGFCAGLLPTQSRWISSHYITGICSKYGKTQWKQWALCIEDDCWRQHHAYQKVPHHLQGPWSEEKQRESTLKGTKNQDRSFFAAVSPSWYGCFATYGLRSLSCLLRVCPAGEPQKNNGSPC